jgi:hypothetical protein
MLISSDFAEPSAGFEPATPSLPRELDGQEVMLRFSLVSADLYSYWID